MYVKRIPYFSIVWISYKKRHSIWIGKVVKICKIKYMPNFRTDSWYTSITFPWTVGDWKSLINITWFNFKLIINERPFSSIMYGRLYATGKNFKYLCGSRKLNSAILHRTAELLMNVNSQARFPRQLHTSQIQKTLLHLKHVYSKYKIITT